MKFSERQGIRPPATTLQTEGMSIELRNSLWNVLHIHVWSAAGFFQRTGPRVDVESLTTALWFEHLKRRIDSRPFEVRRQLDEIRQYFFEEAEWYEVYELLEWVVSWVGKNWRAHHLKLIDALNFVLGRELSGFRMIAGVFSPITDEQEREALEVAMSDTDFPGVRAHLQAALRLMSDRLAPDYRNSIKESISAVESLAKEIVGRPKATLGEALTVLERKSELHRALKQGFSSLYGYTADADGIRHAMLDEPDLDVADAKFFLLSCTSFINYLKSRM